MNYDKVLTLLRGLPGSGKTTFAGMIPEAVNIAADDYPELYTPEFHPERLPQAHEWCKNCVRGAMLAGEQHIMVHNTMTQEWEFQPYMEIAKEYGYSVVSLIVENRHGTTSVHGVPNDVMNKMEKRFDVKLR
jgi:predicted kinase